VRKQLTLSNYILDVLDIVLVVDAVIVVAMLIGGVFRNHAQQKFAAIEPIEKESTNGISVAQRL
jgi:hypothetical protein